MLHTAGLLQDILLQRMAASSMVAVFGSKAAAAACLHSLAARSPLAAMVLFSSVAALLGGAAYRDSYGVVGWSRYSSHRSASPTCSPLEPIMSRDEAEAPRECTRGGRSVRVGLI